MNKYEEFLEPYKKIYDDFMDVVTKKRNEAQEKINNLISVWGDKHPECRGFYVFRCELRSFDRYMSYDWLKGKFDYFHMLDEKHADDEFDESVKIV